MVLLNFDIFSRIPSWNHMHCFLFIQHENMFWELKSSSFHLHTNMLMHLVLEALNFVGIFYGNNKSILSKSQFHESLFLSNVWLLASLKVLSFSSVWSHIISVWLNPIFGVAFFFMDFDVLLYYLYYIYLCFSLSFIFDTNER